MFAPWQSQRSLPKHGYPITSNSFIGKKKPEKIRASTGFEPVTSAILVRCSTNWAMWLHSSVGRASHWYCGGHGFESRWSPDFFRLLLSNCLNWKIYCDDHSLLSSTTAVHIWIISYNFTSMIIIMIMIMIMIVIMIIIMLWVFLFNKLLDYEFEIFIKWVFPQLFPVLPNFLLSLFFRKWPERK